MFWKVLGSLGRFGKFWKGSGSFESFERVEEGDWFIIFWKKEPERDLQKTRRGICGDSLSQNSRSFLKF